MSKVDLRLQCGMPCSKLEVSTVQHGTLSGAGYLHQSPQDLGQTIEGESDPAVASIATRRPGRFAHIGRHDGGNRAACPDSARATSMCIIGAGVIGVMPAGEPGAVSCAAA